MKRRKISATKKKAKQKIPPKSCAILTSTKRKYICQKRALNNKMVDTIL